MSKDLYAIILAGGSGSRLWPLSREMHPKQLLKLNQDNTLFQSTFMRLVESVDDKNIISVTNIKHESALKSELGELKEKFCRESDYKILTEPVGKNTAPAIALGLRYIKSIAGRKTDPVILVMPSDHMVLDVKKFTKALQEGVKLAEEGYIATFGIAPDRADCGYGYIKTQKNKKITEISKTALKAAEFIEKPDSERAQEFINSKKYYWNSGIFAFKASVFLSELKKFSKDIFNALNELELFETQPSASYQQFDKMPDISIDYALMEHSKKLALVPVDCGWSDLGSWEAIYDISDKDNSGNCISGNVIDLNSKNSLIFSTSKLVTTIGLDNLVVVETEDALLVCDKSKTQEVKKVYDKLKAENNDCHKFHKTVYRPWGYYTVMQEGEGFLTKCIVVNPGAKLSMQLHYHRSEHWVALEGRALVKKGGEDYYLNPGESIDIAVQEVHSLQNPYDTPVKILEVQRGDILDENDILRLEDIYGRV